MKLEKMIHSEEQERGVEAIVGGTKDQSSLLQQQLRLLGKTLWQEIEIEGENKSEPHKRLGGETAFPYNQQLWRIEQRVERRLGSPCWKKWNGSLAFHLFCFCLHRAIGCFHLCAVWNMEQWNCPRSHRICSEESALKCNCKDMVCRQQHRHSPPQKVQMEYLHFHEQPNIQIRTSFFCNFKFLLVGCWTQI